MSEREIGMIFEQLKHIKESGDKTETKMDQGFASLHTRITALATNGCAQAEIHNLHVSDLKARMIAVENRGGISRKAASILTTLGVGIGGGAGAAIMSAIGKITGGTNP